MIRSHIVSVTENVAIGAAMVFEIRAILNVNKGNRNGEGKTQIEYAERRDQFFERRDYFESLFHDVLAAGIEAGEFLPVDAAIVTKPFLARITGSASGSARAGGCPATKWRKSWRTFFCRP